MPTIIHGIPVDKASGAIEKAIDRSKLVRRPVMVRVGGKTYQSYRWVKPSTEEEGKRKKLRHKAREKLLAIVDEYMKASGGWNSGAFSPTIPEPKSDATREPRDAQGRLLAPNGKPSNLNERQWLQVRTPAFKEWFGDWEKDTENASKVVDENGEPLVVYHGTDMQFDRFEKNKIGVNFEGWSIGFHFTTMPAEANIYAGSQENKPGANIIPAFISAKNPIEIKSSQAWSPSSLVDNDRYYLQQKVKDENRDGIIAIREKGDEYDGQNIVVFNPTQIKSATGNTGNFDPADPDITKSLTFSGFPLQGRRKVHGMKISIENRKGSYRRGTDKDGHEWKTLMHADYGYIRGTVGKDKDHLDCYVGPNPESTRVFIVHQNDPTTGAYDEDKVMLGFTSAPYAKEIYLKQYDRPGFFGSMEETDIDTFKEKAMAKKNHGKKLVIKKSSPVGAPRILTFEELRRGVSDASRSLGLDPELIVGIQVEKEHTDDPQEARKIAMDHLREDPHYYKKLLAAGLVDEPEALKEADEQGLAKARKNPKLIPIVRTVTRDGTTFPMTVWMLPSDVKAGRIDAARQGDLFDVPLPMMQGDLFDQGPAAEIPAKVEAAKIELAALKTLGDDEAKAQAVALASAETRNAVQSVFFGEPDAASPKAPPAYEYSPETVGVEVLGGIHALDYTGVVPKAIGLLSPSRALDAARPSWVPEVSDAYFRKHDGRLPFIKLAENEYLVQVAGTTSRMASSDDTAYAKVNLEVLAGLHDYYGKRAKATTKKAIADDIAKKKAEAIQWLQEHPESLDENAYNKSTRWYYERAAKGEVKSRIKPFRTIGDNKASYDQYYLIQRATGKTTRSEVWAYFGEMMREYKQKTSDMEIQFEDNSSSFVKGRETSYGDSGTKATLLDQYGVRVKRQNGDEITDSEVADIRSALDSVFGAFGDRSSMARKYGLKISHSGDKLMHARRALGIYCPSYRAIGVTAQLGDKHMGFILAHEWAHFMDNYMGGEMYHYASDKFGSPAHKIADTFRKAMIKPQKSDYQNRTCECFARAFEEYHSIKSGDEETLQEYRLGEGNYVEPERFKATIAPLIEEFLKENNEILKSMRVWSFKL